MPRIEIAFVFPSYRWSRRVNRATSEVLDAELIHRFLGRAVTLIALAQDSSWRSPSHDFLQPAARSAALPCRGAG